MIVAKVLSVYPVQSVLISVVVVLLYFILKERNKRKLPPGPIGLPFVGYRPFLGEEPHKELLELSKKYGSLMSIRMGPKLTIVLNDYEVTKEVITHHAALNRAPNLFDHIPELGFITANGEEWQEQRRFSMQSMRDLGLGRGPWESIVLEEVNNFLDTLSSYKGQPTDISVKLNAAITSNIISLLFGRRLQKGDEDDKIDLFVDYSDVSFTYMGPSLMTSLMPGLREFCQFFKIAGYDRAAKIITDVCKLIKEEVKRHKYVSEYKGAADFVNSYLEEKERRMNLGKKHYFSDVALEGNMKILFLGASDTILSSLGWIFRLMAEYRDIQKKVQDELEDIIGRDGRAKYEERFKIPYTFAVMMESQRFSSIVPLSTTRSVAYDFEVRGYLIPKGAEIFSNLWALHYDPQYWKEPEKFIPERFLKENKKLELNLPSYAPFSMGRRNCPGETVAWMEILVFFTSVLQRFTISLPPGPKSPLDIVNGLVAHLHPQPLVFTERNR